MKQILYIFLLSSILLPFSALSEPAKNVVINEVRVGEAGHGNANNEYIVLFNPTGRDIDLSAIELKLHIRNSSGTDNNKTLTFINKTIFANRFFLIAPNNSYGDLIEADATYSVSSGNKLVDNGGVYISTSKTADVGVIDKVGWGTQPEGGFEGAPFNPSIPVGESIIRKTKGDDSNNNAVDFTISGQNEEGEDLTPEDNDIDGVYINEVMPDPESPKSDITDEWIELYNDSGSRIDLSGAILRDSVGVVHEYTISDGTFIEPKNYIVFYSSATKITLNNSGDTVELLDKSRNIVDQTPDYEKASAGQTFALFPDGWAWTKRPTPLSFNILEEDIEDVKTVKASSTASKKKRAGTKNSKSKSKPSSGVKGASTKKKGGDSPIDSAFAATENSGKPLSGKTLGMILLSLSFVAGAAYIVNREKIYEIYQQKN